MLPLHPRKCLHRAEEWTSVSPCQGGLPREERDDDGGVRGGGGSSGGGGGGSFITITQGLTLVPISAELELTLSLAAQLKLTLLPI